MKPKIGLPVCIITAGSDSNGHNLQPGIITQVWTDTCVNVKVFPDCGEPYDATSQTFHENGPAENSRLSCDCWPA